MQPEKSIDEMIAGINSRNDAPGPVIVIPEQKAEVAVVKPKETPKFCVTCNYWHPNDDARECRRKSPTRDLQCNACWPHTNALMGCGEWEAADEITIARRKEQYIGAN